LAHRDQRDPARHWAFTAELAHGKTVGNEISDVTPPSPRPTLGGKRPNEPKDT
jgi:hypothetical protein